MSCSLLALLLGTFLGFSAQTIRQWPEVEVQQVGSPLSLQCTVRGTSNPNLYWHRQATGGPLQLLFTSVSVGDVQAETQEHLSATRPQDCQFTLRAEKLQPRHSGMYLCAWSAHCGSWTSCCAKTRLQPLSALRGAAPDCRESVCDLLCLQPCEGPRMHPAQGELAQVLREHGQAYAHAVKSLPESGCSPRGTRGALSTAEGAERRSFCGPSGEGKGTHTPRRRAEASPEGGGNPEQP